MNQTQLSASVENLIFTFTVYAHNIQISMSINLENCEGFEWDEANSRKNWYLHEVTDGECEDIFFNLPLIIASDKKYSISEIRFYALGITDANRWLFIAFTIRNNLIRVISARDMTKSEERIYAEKIKRDSRL
jgi:uncharacterized protein